MIAELQAVSKSYPLMETKVLNEVSLRIPSNTSIAITGPSGSGKSTLLNILGTLDTPDSGKLILDGSEPNYSDNQLISNIRNKLIGFVFQSHHLLPQLTLLENIQLPLLPLTNNSEKQQAMERGIALMKRIGLSEKLNSRPSQVSVGECQRTAMVRAMVNSPKLLLADEPTGSLDSENASLLIDLLLELQKEQGFSMVVVTHSMEIATKLQKVYQLKSGSLKQI
ncbi:MAG: ABC transporter ATP-binding protein [Bacteroidales bacterium]|nr:ABC transporter ATP-binding protein [Bacteroidales bacterium]